MKKEKLYIIKIGGKLLDNEEKLNQIVAGFSKINSKKILVHGGGNFASKLSGKLGVPVRMHHGRRITDKESLDIAIMTYAGLLNKKMVTRMQTAGINAIGLTGADAGSISAVKRPVRDIDYGLVGDITSVNKDVLSLFLNAGLCPVFSAIASDEHGQLLNINADSIAAGLAVSLARDYQIYLLYFFDKEGVVVDNKDERIAETISYQDYLKYKKDEVITGGMLPKLENCFYVLRKGVEEVILGNEQYFSSSKYTKIVMN